MMRQYTTIGLLALVLQASGAWAQSGAPIPNTESEPPPAIQNAPPDKRGEPLSTGSTRTLSDQLERSDGVIRPPAGIDPAIRAPAPDPDPGTTIVIPPPGERGGDPTIQPK
jgi:hypothetical protein